MCVQIFCQPFTRCECPSVLSAFIHGMYVSRFFVSLLQGMSVQVFCQPFTKYVCPGFLSIFMQGMRVSSFLVSLLQ